MADNGNSNGRPRLSRMHRTRRGRNIAIALLLVGLVVLFYVITIVRLGGG